MSKKNIATALGKISLNPDVSMKESLENYYRYNPDTLMPLFMLSMSVQGKLSITTDVPQGSVAFGRILIEEVLAYDWVRKNASLRKVLSDAYENGASELCAVAEMPESLKQIYDTFHHYDTFTVEQEYHHRIGILYNHSSNKASDTALRQYATLMLAQGMINESIEDLGKNYLEIANDILVMSGLQPERPRLQVARTLAALLDYDYRKGGKVYNPFAGCGIAAAMLGVGDALYADGDVNDKILAVSRILNYCTSGGKMGNIVQRDSGKWEVGFRPDYILSTYRGYVNDMPAFDFCLSKCLEIDGWNGKFAGIISPKDIFERQSPQMRQALDRDWVHTIVLLPFGEVAVLIDTDKSACYRKKVRFFNGNHPMLSNVDIKALLNGDLYADFIPTRTAKQKNGFRSYIGIELEIRKGCNLVRLGDVVRKISARTYSLKGLPAADRILMTLNPDVKYDKIVPNDSNAFQRRKIANLFCPAYKLQGKALVVNDSGDLQPRIIDCSQGTAFFQGGYAFELLPDTDTSWLIGELQQDYVGRQLHPYGTDVLLHEHFSEEHVLNLVLNKPVPTADSEPDIDTNKLEAGFVLHGENTEYQIHRFLGHGYFGFAYTAGFHNLKTGEKKEVVLKELFPLKYFHRLYGKLVVNDYKQYGSFNWESDVTNFKKEAEIMNHLGQTEDSHIVPAFEVFYSKDTETYYYSMPFYSKGSLEDLQNSYFDFSEDMLIKKVVLPMCKALNLAHKNRVLHLDIKPENILVEDNGDAVLTDFGVAKQYNEDGEVIYWTSTHSVSEYAAPELKTKSDVMIRFSPLPDIYGLAATLYNLATFEEPHPITDFSDEEEDCVDRLEIQGFSEKFARAVASGLLVSTRPKDAQTFLNLFPGCENIKLK